VRSIAVLLVLAGGSAHAGTLTLEGPFAVGTFKVPHVVSTPTIGAHLALSYDAAPLHVDGGGEWTGLIGEGRVPQAWVTVGASLPTDGAVVVYAGPSLRLYDLELDTGAGSGPRVALSGELGLRAMLARIKNRRGQAGTAGLVLRGDVPLAGGDGYAATLGLVIGPSL
jgi:hypothetical protein